MVRINCLLKSFKRLNLTKNVLGFFLFLTTLSRKRLKPFNFMVGKVRYEPRLDLESR